MTPRMLLALASLINALVAFYLHLWKLGLAGSLACTSGGGCEYVQGSRYGWFLGTDVALIGAVGWAVVFVIALVGTLPRWTDDARVTRALTALVAFALLFTLRLKYGEFVVLRSFCPWCAVNAIVVVLSCVLVWRDWVRLRTERQAAGDDYPVSRGARSTTA
ncbi:MAG TPA: vitamin K epoxide reductase family protein [Gemmatirosa sp.]